MAVSKHQYQPLTSIASRQHCKATVKCQQTEGCPVQVYWQAQQAAQPMAAPPGMRQKL